MINTSCKQAAEELLARCLAGERPRDLPALLRQDECGSALVGTFVEGLNDRFEPAHCELYAELFAQALADPGEAAELVAHYRRIREVRPVEWEPRRVFVLSRITLGADIAVTSVVLDAARRRFPHATIYFVGPAKNFELFANAGVEHAAVNYRRGTLRERLAVWPELRAMLDAPDALVLDPDSRLTQLGLLPVCDESRYAFFESRGYGGESAASLPELTAAWVKAVLGIDGARPWISVPQHTAEAGIAVSLGVGENAAKRLPDPFEAGLLRLLGSLQWPITIDRGAGGEESERVERAVAESGVPARMFNGPFAGFASIIASSRLYVGYDSAGQHAAAASGVRSITVFAGFPSPRMFHRWRPTGLDASVIRVDLPDPAAVLERVREALKLPGASQQLR